ncbi:unnamed protein product [Enterobius vermicularis]|uniref:Urokinase plasminogen activator surface receptor-like n=1 Tax=Enterobius vermicularis TaxID=51028 RepID=A0A0N4UW63_ENTVE|nr:unnamed protein product [Enterobius vermicularis]
MLTLLLLTFFHLPNSISQNINQCVECASPGLQHRWALTGFSREYGDNLFTSNCAEAVGWKGFTACDGQCITYMFEDPDASYVKDRNLVIRGCLEKLLDEDLSNRQASNTTSSLCEYDKDFQRLNSQGEMISTKVVSIICSGNLCNGRGITFEDPCKGYTADTSASVPIKCYQCQGENENCHTAKKICSKKYCYKGTIDFHGSKSVYKTCADFNPFGNSAECGQFSTQVTPMNTATVQTTVSHCFCNDKPYCNFAYQSHPFIYQLILVSIILFAIIF